MQPLIKTIYAVTTAGKSTWRNQFNEIDILDTDFLFPLFFGDNVWDLNLLKRNDLTYPFVLKSLKLLFPTISERLITNMHEAHEYLRDKLFDIGFFLEVPVMVERFTKRRQKEGRPVPKDIISAIPRWFSEDAVRKIKATCKICIDLRNDEFISHYLTVDKLGNIYLQEVKSF